MHNELAMDPEDAVDKLADMFASQSVAWKSDLFVHQEGSGVAGRKNANDAEGERLQAGTLCTSLGSSKRSKAAS